MQIAFRLRLLSRLRGAQRGRAASHWAGEQRSDPLPRMQGRTGASPPPPPKAPGL